VTPGPVTGGAATVGGLLLRSAQRWPEADALVEGQTVLTHGQAWARAQTVAARLAARGVRPGDRIGLFMPNGWRYAVAYYGVQLAGAVAVLVNTRFTAPEIDYVLTDSGADFVVVDAGLERPWSVGRPVPRIEVAVAIDEQVVEPDPDAVGELWVRGPAVTAGYWDRPEATAQTFGAAGWLRTGDIGRADAEGYVQVLDRVKDMIIRGGENIYSLEVESVIARHPAVGEVAVVGVPDTVFGERVRAVAVLREGASLSIGTLREWAGTQLADYKLPAELVTVSELPRNASGKVIKKQLAGLVTEIPPESTSR
jgi:acyl-CoA synthetase (AMP-forming)/AMP-acid ligase II